MFFKSLECKNVLLYKHAKFDFAHKGLSVVYADNRDAGRKSTNAAGKSFFFSQIPEMLGICPPLTSKSDKLGGKSSLIFRQNKVDYKVIRKKNKIALIQAGEDKQIHKKRYALEKLQNLHNWTEDEFYSLVYIDSRRPNLLHMGSTKQRRDFIVSMFRLSNVDSVRKFLNAELRRIAEDKSAYEEIKRQYKSLSEQLIDESELELQESVERLEKVYKNLSERVERTTRIEELLTFKQDNKKLIRRLLKLTKRDLDSIDSVIEFYEKDTERLIEDLEHALAWSKYKAKMEEYEEKAVPLIEKLAKYEDLLPEDIEAGVEQYQRAEKKLSYVESAIKDNLKLLPEKVEYDKSHEISDTRRNDLSTRLANLSSLLEQAKKFSGGKCPLCKSPVEIHNPKLIKQKIRNLREKLDLADKARRGAEIRAKRLLIRDTIRGLGERKEKLIIKMGTFERHVKASRIYESIPEKPKKPEGKKQLDETIIRTLLDQNKKRSAFLETAKPLIEKIKKVLRLTEEDKNEVIHLDTLRKRLDAVVEKLPRMRSDYEKMKTVKREMDKLRERAKELRGSVKDEEAYELLVEAYGNAGIKKLMLQRIGSHLEKCLNKYSRFVFSERYDFKVRIDTQFDIIVKRRLVDRTVVSDVRRLSGAEAKAFILLLFLSLLSLVSANRRSNILILDEPDANLGPEMRENLQRFIPILNKIVPHIIIITPHSDMKYEGARVFTVIKERGYSRLERKE